MLFVAKKKQLNEAVRFGNCVLTMTTQRARCANCSATRVMSSLGILARIRLYSGPPLNIWRDMQGVNK